jgi:HSP20 family molecular chaperone IbpA
MQLPSVLKDIQMTPGMMQGANTLWKMMDEMAANDPEAYEKFLKQQMVAAGVAGGVAEVKKPETPLAAFCVRLRLEGGMAIFANVCHHTRIQAPSAVKDGTIPIAVGIPREVMHKTTKGFALDLVVHVEVTRRCEVDPSFREEIAALVSECVRDAVGRHRLLPGKLILPGFRALPASDARYVGTPQPFVDAAGPPKAPASGSGSAEGSGLGSMPAFVQQMIGGMGAKGGGAGGSKAVSGGAKAGTSGARPGVATSSTRATHEADETSELIRGLKLPGGRDGPSPAGTSASASSAADGMSVAALSTQMPPPGAPPAPPRKPLVQELSSSEAVEETPEHELLAEEDALTLVVRVPRVTVVSDLDVEIGEALVCVRAEGVYALELPLPKTIRSDDAKCKFDKKKRVLTIAMPLV